MTATKKTTHKTPTKQFLTVWGEGYERVHGGRKGISFFREELGYSEDAISKVKKLRKGQVADLTDPSGVHIVVRMK